MAMAGKQAVSDARQLTDSRQTDQRSKQMIVKTGQLLPEATKGIDPDMDRPFGIDHVHLLHQLFVREAMPRGIEIRCADIDISDRSRILDFLVMTDLPVADPARAVIEDCESWSIIHNFDYSN